MVTITTPNGKDLQPPSFEPTKGSAGVSSHTCVPGSWCLMIKQTAAVSPIDHSDHSCLCMWVGQISFAGTGKGGKMGLEGKTGRQVVLEGR